MKTIFLILLLSTFVYSYEILNDTLIDLTGDNVEDSLVIQYSKLDSGKISLKIFVKDKEKFNVSWYYNDYFFYLLKYTLSTQKKDSIVFSDLKSFFNESFENIGKSKYKQLWQPSAFPDNDPRDLIAYQLKLEPIKNKAHKDSVSIIWKELIDNNIMTFSFAYGIERVITLVWSNKLNEFIYIFSCC